MLTSCPKCGGALSREPRSFIQRMYLRRIDECRVCHARYRTFRVPFSDASRFLFSRYSHCIQCGSKKVKRLAQRDRIDGLSKHPLSVLLGLTFAPLNHCNACRLQYHDWRRPEP